MAENATVKARRVWDAFAPRYDKVMRFYERIQFKGGREWVCGRAQGEVLEVAVGTGLNLALYPSSVRLTGVDLSPEMLAVARARADQRGLPVDLREGDAESLPVEDAAYDTVVCSLSMCSIPDPAAAIDEMKRVLVPGGRLLLLDHVGSTWPPIYAVQWLAERISVRMAGEYYTRRPLPWVEAAGFEIVETERRKAGVMERVHAVKPG